MFSGNTFRNNSANIYSENDDYFGGAIFYQCPVYYGFKCNVTLKNRNTFVNNTSLKQGGAISYTHKKFYDDNSTIFVSNSAIYGQNVSSYPKSLVFSGFTNNDPSLSTTSLLRRQL